MTLEQIKAMVDGEEYSFLRTNPHLGKRIMFLTLGGSYAYGTNVESSDVDVRGCALNSQSDLIGLSTFDQFVHTQTDTTVYGFNKLVGLLLNCNPNTIEMLGCKPEHYFYVSDAGRMMLNNATLFLSQRAVNSFGGYATQQLRRLENALARDRMPQAQKEEHIRGALERSLKDFATKYSNFDQGCIKLFTSDSLRDDLDKEVFCNIHLDKYPARDFSIMLNTLSSVIRDYEKLHHRNHKKDDEHLNKHASHLIRLYLMCLDILEKGEINTYRDKNRELLLDIRKGKYQKEDGSYMPEFFEMVSYFERCLKYAKANTSLPPHPDMKKVEEFVIEVNRSAIAMDDN